MKPGCPRRSGFTLVEVMVALIIFAILTLALSMTLSSALHTQAELQEHQEQAGSVRAIFDLLTRDLQGAHASLNDPNSVFIAGATQGQTNPGGSGLLTLTSLTQRIESEALAAAQMSAGQSAGSGSATSSAGQSMPQWDSALVRYDLDTQSGTLRRIVSAVPNLQTMGGVSRSDTKSVLAENIVSLTLRYWDSSQQTWREDWDFEQQNQSASSGQNTTGQQTSNGQNTTGQQTGTGQQTTGQTNTPANGGTGGQTGNSAGNTSANGDSVLPTAVEVTLVLRSKDGTPATYITTIPVIAPQPQDAGTGTGSNGAGTNGSGTNGSGTNGATGTTGSGTNTGQSGATGTGSGSGQSGVTGG
jgi:prepilin-type N-terminal cleavage/methylation domain-containing protein